MDQLLGSTPGRRKRLCDMQLISVSEELLTYEKNEMHEYLCNKWTDTLKQNIKDITNWDPYNIEALQSDEELGNLVDMAATTSYPLFCRNESRLDNTNMADFLHGRCLRFQNFALSVLKTDKSNQVPWCHECCSAPDSVYHKVFECENFIFE